MHIRYCICGNVASYKFAKDKYCTCCATCKKKGMNSHIHFPSDDELPNVLVELTPTLKDHINQIYN
jgi:hypothetical protein